MRRRSHDCHLEALARSDEGMAGKVKIDAGSGREERGGEVEGDGRCRGTQSRNNGLTIVNSMPSLGLTKEWPEEIKIKAMGEG
jgi:hypothetical protein